MKIEQRHWTPNDGWQVVSSSNGPLAKANLVLVFGAPDCLQDANWYRAVQNFYKGAHVVACSTGGEIHGTEVSDESIVATAIGFDNSTIRVAAEPLAGPNDSASAGERLARSIPHEGLRHVFVVSEGVDVNGSALVRGLTSNLPMHVAVTGGLSADGDRFKKTFVGLDAVPKPHQAVAVGFYGDRLRVAFASLGGWDTFGPDRLITRSEGNVLFELDGVPALELYRRYLGPHAAELPASGLRFPLRIAAQAGEDDGVVRTILGIDDQAGALIFAGDVPQGMYARLMQANLDRLIDGAAGAASGTHEYFGGQDPDLALLVSCIGRKMVLGQRVEEEVENVRDVLGPRTVMSGFYSYGEISPMTPNATCELHNQTMTITTLSEH